MATSYASLSPGVYVEEVSKGGKPIEGIGTAVAAFIGFAEKSPKENPYGPHLVTNWNEFSRKFGDFIEGSFLAPAVYGYFQNGGGTCYVTRLPVELRPCVESNGHVTGQTTRAARSFVLPRRGAGGAPTLEVTELDGTPAGELSVEVRPADDGLPEDNFTMVVRRTETEETFANLTMSRGRATRNAVDIVNRESRLVKVADREAGGNSGERAPAVGTYTAPIVVTEPPAEPGTALALPDIRPAVFVGDTGQRTGIKGYEANDTVTMVCVPDLMAAYLARRISLEGVQEVQQALFEHCQAMKDRVAILDAPPSLDGPPEKPRDMTPQEIVDWRVNVANYDSHFAAMYYPWIRVSHPLGKGGGRLVPPSGHMAGVWARSDSERGVHKAPANEIVRGALALDLQISRNEHGTLNPVGINCIRTFPGRGIRVWGARTLSNDSDWRYLNVRRLFNYVERSIDAGTQWVVFEPNDMYLWAKVKRDVSAFLTRVWRDGALFGAAPEDAFYVKCDEELNPKDVRDLGQLIVEIAIAPVKPAEFVIFRISQQAGAAAE